jgi:alpha-tubulin suppressor-like RCC1 family protein
MLPSPDGIVRMKTRMKQLFPKALALAGRFSKPIMLPKLETLLFGIALLGFATRGWAQGGTVIAWGNNDYGQTAVPAGLSNVVAIATGEWHNLALKADGTVIAWGANNVGQGTVPSDLNNVVVIAAAGYHNLALKADGTVRAWGWNEFGQATVPAGLTDVVAIAGGWSHSLALKADGTVIAWGRNNEGQTNVPSGLNNVVAITAGEYHNLALKADGTVTAWGWNGAGQTTVPAGLNNVVAVAACGLHSLALKADGTVTAWGLNELGQATVPAGLGGVVAIAGGTEHSLALKSDGTVVGWGSNQAWENSDCQFIGHPGCVRKPAGQIDIPAGLSRVVAIAAGNFHSVALKAENAVPAPSAPALSVRAVGDTSVRLSWSDLANETGYRLEARVGVTGNWAEIATPGANATSYHHTGLPAGTTIFYRLRAFNTGGVSPYSAEVTATTPGAPVLPPSAPSLQATATSPTEVRLQWSDVANEVNYIIERRLDAVTAWTTVTTLGADATSFTEPGLAPETTYVYRVRAANGGGESAWSEATVRTPAKPLEPISNNPLTFRALGADPNGMRVRISGDSGQRFKVQRTTDFRNWTDVATSVLLSPSTEMTLSGEVTGGMFRTVNTQ